MIHFTPVTIGRSGGFLQIRGQGGYLENSMSANRESLERLSFAKHGKFQKNGKSLLSRPGGKSDYKARW